MVGGTWDNESGTGSGTWEFVDGTLTVNGTGAVAPSSAPWIEYASSVSALVFGSGITSIGTSFMFCTNIATLQLPDTLESLGGLGFPKSAYLTELVIPDNVKYIGTSTDSEGIAYSMLSPGPTRLVIGSGVLGIGGMAFKGCYTLKEIVFRGPQPQFFYYTSLGSKPYDNFSLGTADNPASVIVYTKGWGSDEVFTTAIRGSYTTFEYRKLTYNITPSAIPAKALGYWRRAHYKVNVGGVWKQKVLAWVKKNGRWIPIGDSYQGEPTPSTVTFNANGGTGTMNSITGFTVTIPTNSFTKANHEFIGWNTKADGSGTSYTAGQSVALSGNITLYAIWIRQYTVGFNANGGTGTVASIVTTGTTVTLPANAFTRSKHRFDRWNTKADGSGTSYSAGQTITLSGDMTLYAIWVQQVTVTYYKIYAAGNTSQYPPASNSGPVSGYLDLKIGNVTVPYLGDNFTASGNLSPTRTLTVDKGTSLSVSIKNYIGSNRCNIYVNGSQVVANASSGSYALPNGIQSDVEVQMMWTMEFLWGTVPQSSAWTVGISGGT